MVHHHTDRKFDTMSLSGSAEKQRLARKRLSMLRAARASPTSKPSSSLPPVMAPPQEMNVKVADLDSPSNKSWTRPPMSPHQEMRLKLLPHIAECRAKEWISPKEEAEMSRLLLSPKRDATLQVAKSLYLAGERQEKVTESKAVPVASNSRSLFKKTTKVPAGEQLTLARKLSFRRQSRLDMCSERGVSEKEELRDVKEEESDDDTIDTGDFSNIQALFGRPGCNSESPKEKTRESEEEQKTTPDMKCKNEGPREEEKTTPVDKKNEGGDLRGEKKISPLRSIQVMLPFGEDGRTSAGPKDEEKITPVERKSDRFAKMRYRILKSKVQQGSVITSSLSIKDTRSKSEIVKLPQEIDDMPSLGTMDNKSKNGDIQWPHMNVNKLSSDTEDTNSKTEANHHSWSVNIPGEVKRWSPRQLHSTVKVQQENDEISSFATKDAKGSSMNKVINVMQENVAPANKYVKQPVRSVPLEYAMKEKSNNTIPSEEQQICEPRHKSALSQEEIKDLFVVLFLS